MPIRCIDGLMGIWQFIVVIGVVHPVSITLSLCITTRSRLRVEADKMLWDDSECANAHWLVLMRSESIKRKKEKRNPINWVSIALG